jgi:pyrroline-5-carboxylate reductase
MKKVVIIGNGKMAEAILCGLKDSFDVVVVGRDLYSLELLKNSYKSITIALLKDFDISGQNIILAVKPYAVDSVAKLVKGEANIILSVLAGTQIDSIKSKIAAKSYVRAMPNLSASYLKSATSLTGDIESKEFALEVFNSIGSTIWLGSEKELDISTGIVGSGPALLALIAEAFMDSGVYCGLKRDDSIKLTQMLFESFPPILNDKHPAFIKDSVMSPAGTTSSAYFELEKANTRATIIKAIDSAYQRALEIKEK